MKVVINNCYGGFGLSLKGQKRYAELKGFDLWFYRQNEYRHSHGKDKYVKIADLNSTSMFIFPVTKDLGNETHELPNGCFWASRDISRDDPILIQVITELGEQANGVCGSLKIVDIPDGVEWQIEEYDGNEWIAEKHHTWS